MQWLCFSFLDNCMDSFRCPTDVHGIIDFSSRNGLHHAKGCILLLALWCAIGQHNHTQHHYHTHDAEALMYAGSSLKHIVRDGIN